MCSIVKQKLPKLFLLPIALIISNNILSQITVNDNSIFFSKNATAWSSSKNVGNRVEKFTRFKIEHTFKEEGENFSFQVEGFSPNEYSPFYMPYQDGINSANFFISKNKKYAVLMMYAAHRPSSGAEQPWVCTTKAVSVNELGQILGWEEGDFIEAEMHNELPLFLLIKSSCCDGNRYAELYNIYGKRLKVIKDHRDFYCQSKDYYTEFEYKMEIF